MKRKRFSKEFKLQVVQEMESGRDLVELCRQHDIASSLVYRWQREYEANPDLAFSGNGNPTTEETKVAQLERKIGQLYVQNEWIKSVNDKLRRVIVEIKKNEK